LIILPTLFFAIDYFRYFHGFQYYFGYSSPPLFSRLIIFAISFFAD